MTLKGLAEKYGISFSSVQKRCIREKWTDSRKAAKIKVDEYVIRKTSEKVADNAALAADIKRKGLMLLNRLFDDFADVKATERRETSDNVTEIKRLRDLTAAYKDLTDDITQGDHRANELLQSLLEMERRGGNG